MCAKKSRGEPGWLSRDMERKLDLTRPVGCVVIGGGSFISRTREVSGGFQAEK